MPRRPELGSGGSGRGGHPRRAKAADAAALPKAPPPA
eukprot:CAMPEP_0175753408 /NCGR_PEP_ID=MMETSP0097-20121207/62289_1 /TAXON_ID=311494 /ORGANISM="Alexandrium monilatum, Strain CCMP3105" /LENGTH=36 /DNA_ID= /DNA_START= /DNA_END= /DNA_ORIENTATION=